MAEGTAELERAIADACLGAATGERLATDLRGFLEGHGVAADDVDAILAAPQHLAIYRTLVRNGLEGVVVRMLPRTRARMNEACPGRFDADVARFLDEVGPRTHYLRDVPHELYAWARPRWTGDAAVPAYLPDLAAYELACFGVSAAEHRAEGVPGEIAPDRPVAFDGSARLLRLGWTVHELADDDTTTEVPTRRDVRLLAYRDAEHAVRWLELSPLAAAIVSRLMAGEPLQAAVTRACDEVGAAAPGDVARLLADLGARGVLLGSRSG
jgi:hypothetical protein